MKFFMVLFLAITLFSLSPSAAFCRDVNKYTVEYNSNVLNDLGKELYDFVAGLDTLENNWPVRRHITTTLFEIIDKYNCDKRLYVINRGLNVKIEEDKITGINITIFIMNSLEYIDTVFVKFDIDAVKKGDPIKMKSSRIQI